MMREDVVCQACPDPDTAFKVEDVGVKLAWDESDDGAAGPADPPGMEGAHAHSS